MLQAHEQATAYCDHVQLHECGFDGMIWDVLVEVLKIFMASQQSKCNLIDGR